MDPAIDNIILTDSKIEIIAEGFKWSEGLLWIGKTNERSKQRN
jgi:hypothetical protein